MVGAGIAGGQGEMVEFTGLGPEQMQTVRERGEHTGECEPAAQCCPLGEGTRVEPPEQLCLPRGRRSGEPGALRAVVFCPSYLYLF